MVLRNVGMLPHHSLQGITLHPEDGSPKRWYTTRSLHGVITQNTAN